MSVGEQPLDASDGPPLVPSWMTPSTTSVSSIEEILASFSPQPPSTGTQPGPVVEDDSPHSQPPSFPDFLKFSRTVNGDVKVVIAGPLDPAKAGVLGVLMSQSLPNISAAPPQDPIDTLEPQDSMVLVQAVRKPQTPTSAQVPPSSRGSIDDATQPRGRHQETAQKPKNRAGVKFVALCAITTVFGMGSCNVGYAITSGDGSALTDPLHVVKRIAGR
ncbi:MAG: hypothetical protein WAQ24_04155 [Candidatus Saccharimonadales bacterium]